ncbi:MAG: hypothetical protein ACTSYC_07065 [Promethearchaeota archaeon]
MIAQDVFPITGMYREPLLILEYLITFLFFEQSFFLWTRFHGKNKMKLKSLEEKAYFWLFLGYAFMWMFFVIADFYVQSSYFHDLFSTIGMSIQVASIILFFKIMENLKVYFKRYLFTRISLIFLPVYMIIILIDISIGFIFGHLYMSILIIFFILYFISMRSKLQVKKEIINLQFEIFKFSLGILIIIIGFFLITPYIIVPFGVIYRFYGDIIQLIGFILLAWFFISVPSLTEYAWQDKLESIFIIHKSGLLIYKKNFRKRIDTSLGEYVFSGSLIMLKMMLEQATQVEGLSIIEKEGKIIIVQPSTHVYSILICDELLKHYQILLNKLTSRIEELFSPILEDWKGNLNAFSPMEHLIEEIFF